MSAGNDSPSQVSGRVYFLQTIGNFLGAVVTGSFLVLKVGTIGTFLAFGGTLATISLLISASIGRRRLIITIVALVIAAPILALLKGPYYKPFQRVFHLPAPLTRITEQLEGTAFIYEDQPTRYGASIFIGAEPATSYQYVGGKNGVECGWPLSVGLAQLQHDPKNILVIGIGTGNGAIALHKLYPQAKIYIVELLSVVIDEMRSRGYSGLRDMLASADVSIMDGSRFVKQNAASLAGKFDFVQIGILHVTAAGSGNLFTREFLSEIRDIMAPDGVLTFNAYPGALKAGEGLFKNIAISSWGESQVADAFLWDGNAGDVVRKTVAFEKTLTTSVKACIPKSGFLITNRAKIEKALEPVTVQTNDLVASENFLFTHNDVYTETEKYRLRSCFAKPKFSTQSTDLRKWSSTLADCDHECLLGKRDISGEASLPHAEAR